MTVLVFRFGKIVVVVAAVAVAVAVAGIVRTKTLRDQFHHTAPPNSF